MKSTAMKREMNLLLAPPVITVVPAFSVPVWVAGVFADHPPPTTDESSAGLRGRGAGMGRFGDQIGRLALFVLAAQSDSHDPGCRSANHPHLRSKHSPWRFVMVNSPLRFRTREVG